MAVPTWIREVQALSSPVIAIGAAVIAAMSAMVSYRQAKTAKQKLRLDMFPFRIIVYHRVKDAILVALRDDSQAVRYEATKGLSIALREARFLFNKDTYEYLDSIETRLLQYTNPMIISRGPIFNTDTERQRMTESRSADEKWLFENLHIPPMKLEPELRVDEKATFGSARTSDKRL